MQTNRLIPFGAPVERIQGPIDLGETAHALRFAERIDDAIAETNRQTQNPEVLAHAASDATRQHDSITVENLRGAIEELRTQGDLLSVQAEEFIEAQQARGAKIIEGLRAHTARMAALRRHLTDATEMLKQEFTGQDNG